MGIVMGLALGSKLQGWPTMSAFSGMASILSGFRKLNHPGMFRPGLILISRISPASGIHHLQWSRIQVSGFCSFTGRQRLPEPRFRWYFLPVPGRSIQFSGHDRCNRAKIPAWFDCHRHHGDWDFASSSTPGKTASHRRP